MRYPGDRQKNKQTNKQTKVKTWPPGGGKNPRIVRSYIFPNQPAIGSYLFDIQSKIRVLISVN